jgi:cyclase
VSINTAAVKDPQFVREAALRFGSQCIVVNIDPRRVESRELRVESGELRVERGELRVESQEVRGKGNSMASTALSQVPPSLRVISRPWPVQGPGSQRHSTGNSPLSALDSQLSALSSPLSSLSSQHSTLNSQLSMCYWDVHIHGGRTATGLDAVAWAKEVERLGAGEIVLTSMDADGTKDGYDIEITRAVAEAVEIPVVASGGAGSPAHLYEAVTDGQASAALAASIFHYGEYTIAQTKAYLAERGVPVRVC